MAMVSEHIEDRDGVYSIRATRISLDSIVYAFREGCSPESIREDFEGLTLAQVYGAIGFCLDHQAQVEAYLARRKEEWDELERHGSPPSVDLQARRARDRIASPRQ